MQRLIDEIDNLSMGFLNGDMIGVKRGRNGEIQLGFISDGNLNGLGVVLDS